MTRIPKASRVGLSIGLLLLVVAGRCSDPAPLATAVAISSPTTTVHINGTLTVQVAVSGGVPDSVELRRDGQLLVSLVAPYTYSWVTTNEAEGSYQLTAVARLADSKVTSEPRTVVVDRTSPSVIDRWPAPGDDSVWIGDTIEVAFSEPLRASTVTDANVVLTATGAGELAKGLSLSDDGTLLRISLISAPSVPTTITATLSENITDLAGNPLASPAGAWQWELPTWHHMGSVNVDGTKTGRSSSLAIDSNGRPIITWVEYTGVSIIRNVYVKRWTGNEWQQLGGSLDADPAQIAERPVLALTSTGQPIVAWNEEDGTSNKLYVKRWTGSSWESLGSHLNLNAGRSVNSQAIALAAPAPPVAAPVDIGPNQVDTRQPVVAWGETRGFISDLFVARWTGSSWQNMGAALNTDPERGARNPAITSDGDGRPVVAWSEFDGISSKLYVKRWTGSSWQSLGAALNFDPTRSAAHLSITRDADGRPVVAWFEHHGQSQSVHVARWTGDEYWANLGAGLNDDPARPARAPSITSDGDGRLVVALIEYDGAAQKLYVKRWTGSAWEPVGTALNVDPARSAEDPSIASGSNGGLAVAWSERDDSGGQVRVKRYNQLP